MEILKIRGLHCGGCASRVEQALGPIPGVEKIEVKLEEQSALVTYDPERISRQKLAETVEDVGYDVE